MSSRINAKISDETIAMTMFSSLISEIQDTTESGFVYRTDFKSAGIHRLTVVVSDPSSRVEMTWNIRVTDVNRAPVLLIDLPAPNAAYSSGEKVRLLASATDPDGDTLQYTWSENGAVIGKLADISNIFRSGTHTIRCEVTDGKEMTAKEITFTVKKPAANNQPGFEAVAVLGVLLLALVLLGRKR